MMHLTQDKYRSMYLFNLIEQGENKKVMEFFDQFPEYINKISTDQEWTPIMCACRFGNFELLLMLKEKGFILDKSIASNLVHLAHYSDNMKVLRYLLTQLDTSHKEITQLTRFSSFQKKSAATFYLLLNGGYLVSGTSANPICYNVYPEKVADKQVQSPVPPQRQEVVRLQIPNGVKYMSLDKREELNPQQECLIVFDQRDILRDYLAPLVAASRKYLFDYTLDFITHPAQYKIAEIPETPPSEKEKEMHGIHTMLKYIATSSEAYNNVIRFL